MIVDDAIILVSVGPLRQIKKPSNNIDARDGKKIGAKKNIHNFQWETTTTTTTKVIDIVEYDRVPFHVVVEMEQ